MNILHVIDSFQPQLGYQETFLAREQAKLGHDVCVVTSDRYYADLYSGNKELLGERIKGAGYFTEEGINVWRLKTLFKVPPRQPWLRGLEDKVKELQPDIIIVHGIANFSAIRLARLKRQMPHFKLICDDHMTDDNSTSKMRIFYPLFKWTFSHVIQKNADALVAVLPQTRIFMHEKYGMPIEKIEIIPLGADDELFRFDAVTRRLTRKRLGIDDGDIVIIYTGKIIPFKRLPLLIEAVSILAGKNPEIKVLLVGDGERAHIDELRRLIRDRRLEDRFIWHEAVPNEELPRLYSAADVAVWPYGASISQREAMACSLPLILSDASMVTALVSNNNGFLFKEEDADDLAYQIKKLLNPELRKKTGYNSRKYIEEKLSWRVIAGKFLEL